MRRRKVALAAVAVAACVLALPSAAAAITLPAGFDEVTLVTGLNNPSDTEFAADGRTFVASGSDDVRVVAAGSTVPSILYTLKTGGTIYGIALDKDFASNGYLYMLYTTGVNARLSRIVVNTNNTLQNPASPETVLLGKLALGPCPPASNTSDCIRSDPNDHNVGTVISDPRDGTLWVGDGDNASPGAVDPRAFETYNEQSYAGKMLHIDRAGNGLPGHSFCPTDTTLTHVCTKVYAKGLRNPYRFSLRPSGLPVAGDTGWNTREEIDIVRAGKNYGWPCYEGTVRTPGYRDDPRCTAEYAKEGTADASVGPVYDYARPASGAAMVGGPTYLGPNYPAEYNGDVFFTDYVQGFIKRLKLDSQDRFVSVQNFATATGPIVDLELDRSGDLVYSLYTAPGAVRRIRYAPTNRAPVAQASASPSSGPTPLTVNFRGADSSDPDGDALTYDWDFGDGSAHSSQPNPSHVYSDGSRDFTARLTVSDGKGGSDDETVTISPGNTPPNVSITAPASFRDGQTVSLSGSATDTQDGNLAATTFEWSVRLIHITHVHPISNPSGVASTSFVAATDHDADSHYEVTLTATDSRGSSASDTVSINPETVPFTIDTNPQGAGISYAGTALTAPFSQQSTIGFKTSVSAVQQFTSGGKNYVFDSWSDGGARLHDITIPAQASTLTAKYVESVTGPRKALFVVGNTTLSAADLAVRNRLVAAGYAVTTIDDNVATSANATGMDVVLISSSTGSTTVAGTFRTTPVPVVVWEGWVFDDMSLTGPTAYTDFGDIATQTQLRINAPSSPLAAGLTGTRTVTSSPMTFHWGQPTAAATKAALLAPDARAAIFGYDTGAAMVGGFNAPARRVGLFLHNTTPTALTTDGWQLFDAAVDWAEAG